MTRSIMKNITIYSNDIEKIENAKKELKFNFSEFVRECIAKHLDNYLERLLIERSQELETQSE